MMKQLTFQRNKCKYTRQNESNNNNKKKWKWNRMCVCLSAGRSSVWIECKPTYDMTLFWRFLGQNLVDCCLIFTINRHSKDPNSISGFITFLFIVTNIHFGPFFSDGRYRPTLLKYRIWCADILGFLEVLCSLAIVVQCDIRSKTRVIFRKKNKKTA